MDMNNTASNSGSLQISTEVIAKIAKIAALEIEGVCAVRLGSQGVKGLLGKASLQRPIQVQMQDGVAEITLNLVIAYGSKINALSEKVQANVKSAVQNMTSITVSRVNVVIVGLAEQKPEAPAEEVL